MQWSDLQSGALLFIVAGLALAPRFDFIGSWTGRPRRRLAAVRALVFWAPSAVGER
jgi:hypothetical protein